MIEQSLLDEVITHYIESGDFNGLPVATREWTSQELQSVAGLVEAGQVQVVSSSHFLNPYVRPWPSKRSAADQVSDLTSANSGPVCLYPTPAAMKGRDELSGFADRPYRRCLAAGAGTLELAYFTVDIIEQYRNDPRYHYQFDDVEVMFGIGDEAYHDPAQGERDKITTLRVGFAYDSATIRAERVVRYACAFIGDLADLTPEHQQRWRTYEVSPSDRVGPHPVWWNMQMGQWSEGLGPFQRILGEMEAVNELFARACGVELFRSTEQPRDWGWVLRSSTTEWHQFVHTTDKLLSDNLNKKVLDAVKARAETDDGNAAGTLTRLGYYLTDSTPTTPELRDRVLGPLRDVRKQRQRPAHALTVASTDASLAAQQRDLVNEVADALRLLRQILQCHPANGEWSPDDFLDQDGYVV